MKNKWEVGHCPDMIVSGGNIVAVTYGKDQIPNARLVAAAPDLLAALRNLVQANTPEVQNGTAQVNALAVANKLLKQLEK